MSNKSAGIISYEKEVRVAYARTEDPRFGTRFLVLHREDHI